MMLFRQAPKLAALAACLIGVIFGVTLGFYLSNRNVSLMLGIPFLKREDTTQKGESYELLVDVEDVVESVTRRQNDSLVKASEQKAVNNTSWCPNAVCQDSDICYPCDRKFLIIIAAGRSGSTTLTYMMDSLPGVRMSGENNNELKALRLMVDNIRNNPNFRQASGQRSPWGHNAVPGGAYACPVQKMIETINPPKMQGGHTLEDDSRTIIGFKTIRFVKDTQDTQDKAMVDFVKEMFPCSRIIVNIRSDTESLMKSRDKAFGQHSQQALVDLETQRLRKVAQLFGESARLLDSTEWLNDISKLNEIVTWLGFHRSCYFTELLEFNRIGSYGNGRTKLQHDPQCKYLGQDNPS